MTGKVWIDIEGTRITDGEREPVKETASGEYYKRNGKHYIIGSRDGGFLKRMKLAENSLTIIRNYAGSQMVFEKGEKSRVFYDTPGGSLTLEIRTHRFGWREGEDCLDITMEYSLYHGDSRISDSSMKVRIYPQQEP